MMEYLEGDEPSVDKLKAVSEKLHVSVQQYRFAAVPLTENKGVQKTSGCNP